MRHVAENEDRVYCAWACTGSSSVWECRWGMAVQRHAWHVLRLSVHEGISSVDVHIKYCVSVDVHIKYCVLATLNSSSSGVKAPHT